MRVLIQRVSHSQVSINKEVVGQIKNGFCLFVGFQEGDTSLEVEKMVNKILKLRIFKDEKGLLNKNIKDVDGQILSISQFTLYADTKKGNRPSFTKTLVYQSAEKLYNEFNLLLKENNIKVETGSFGEVMEVEIINDGPITILLEEEK